MSNIIILPKEAKYKWKSCVCLALPVFHYDKRISIKEKKCRIFFFFTFRLTALIIYYLQNCGSITNYVGFRVQIIFSPAFIHDR